MDLPGVPVPALLRERLLLALRRGVQRAAAVPGLQAGRPPPQHPGHARGVPRQLRAPPGPAFGLVPVPWDEAGDGVH